MLEIARLMGLRPQVWLCVGSGFAREDLKSVLLSTGRGFIGDAILNIQELCLKLTGIPKSQVLSTFARQEVLRMLLAEPKVLGPLNEIKRLKRQRNFIRNLDRAFQSARMAFAHGEEEQVYHERLVQSLGENSLRAELSLLAQAYEVWLQASSLWDPPLLIRHAIQTLRDGWPKSVARPEEIWTLSVQMSESLERDFWDTIGRILPVKSQSSDWSYDLRPEQVASRVIEWQRWHTLDDAAEFLADQISHRIQDRKQGEIQDRMQSHAILIPDVPSIRRSLRRVFDRRGMILADPRDPTRLLWDESFKWALLPMQVVAHRFERRRVISWLRTFEMSSNFPAWVNEINSRGILNGISSYAGGKLSDVYSRLKELEGVFAGKKACKEMEESFLAHLRKSIESLPASPSNSLGSPSGGPPKSDLLPFFEKLWTDLSEDLERAGTALRKAPALYWLDRLQSRLSESGPPVERLKPREGIRLYRLQQAPVPIPRKEIRNLWVFGLPSQWLSGEGTGSYWYSERDRELLASEFAVRSSVQVREERLATLKAWMKSARDQVTILDSHYGLEGRERESIFPVLKELETALGEPIPESPIEQGACRRFSRSFETVQPAPPQRIQLPPGVPRITATALDRYSQCSFLGLAYHRWGLRDAREPDSELWPDVKGNILHESVRLLMKNTKKGSTVVPGPTPAPSTIGPNLVQTTVEEVWRSSASHGRFGVKGLIRSPRIENYIKAQMVKLLEAFQKKEQEYRERSGVSSYDLDETQFELDCGGVVVTGRPDRIDQHKEGLFIIDYKTSGTPPHGFEILENGYRLQLPFYALAVDRKTGQKILGLQFVEMDRRGSRKSGILFKDYNGKEEGCLSQLKANSKSLIEKSPEETWSVLEKHLKQTAKNFVEGKFEARPNQATTSKRDQECSRCRVADLCGHRRRKSE